MDNTEKRMVLFTTLDNKVSVDVHFDEDTVWLTIDDMSNLYEKSRSTINEHILNVYEEGELEEISTKRKIGNSDFSTKPTNYYNLDVIISVGYRVKSLRGTQFRQWATKRLNEYMRKGFILDDERLKQGMTLFGKDYFRELLERVRSIRASERRIWQQITDIFAECSIDYDKNAPITHDFYATIQNKFHYAITGKTAAEIVYTEADATKENMNLKTWKNSPSGRILKSDVTIAKNYLNEKGIKRLERAVTGYFDYIEDLIENENSFTMEEFIKSVNEFLAFRKFKILPNKGHISKAEADKKAHAEYDIFNKTQKIVSDFDRSLKELTELMKKT
jgi:hypothetical protein